MAPTHPFSAAEAEAAIRRMCADHDLREPDEIQPRAAGGITCIWYEEKLVLIVEDEERRGRAAPRAGPPARPSAASRGPASGASADPPPEPPADPPPELPGDPPPEPPAEPPPDPPPEPPPEPPDP